MTAILSTVFVVYFIYYASSTVGSRFYGNIGDVIFLAIALPIIFIPSRFKIVGYVRSARSNYLKFGRVMLFLAGYLALLIFTSYIPIELRTLSTAKLIRHSIESQANLKPVRKIVVFSYDKPNAEVLVISGDRSKSRRYFVSLKKQNEEWKIDKIEHINPQYRTFPSY